MAVTNKQRLDMIEAYIREHRYADLHVLADKFEISLSTVRRALNDLEAAGTIRRHHGGASILSQDNGGGYDFITQDLANAKAKARIAAFFAEHIKDGMTVMIDGGTTTYAVAKAILHKRLVIITNSLPIAALLNEVSNCETLLTGGTLYNRLGVLYGPVCERNLAELHADAAILGCAGLTPEGVWNSNTMLAGYQRKMLHAADHAWCVADASKLGRRAISLTSPFRSNISVVCDGADPALSSAMQEAQSRFFKV